MKPSLSIEQQRKLLIIDGPSASGKSTILDLLLQNESIKFEVAKRVTTRQRRKDDENNPAYIFVSPETFAKMISAEELLEFHHYLFGMSYGLPLQNVEELLRQGKYVIGMINLGNINMLREKIPHCFSVMITASTNTIRKRLESRGLHTEEQIDERIGNAKRSKAFEKDYNLTIYNDGITPDETVQKIIEHFKTLLP